MPNNTSKFSGVSIFPSVLLPSLLTLFHLSFFPSFIQRGNFLECSKEQALEPDDQDQKSALSLTRCVTLCRLLNLSVLQFYHLFDRDPDSAYFIGLSRGLN